MVTVWLLHLQPLMFQAFILAIQGGEVLGGVGTNIGSRKLS